MAKRGEATIDVKLFIDKEKSRVLFAESDKEFVDVLFSFLTLPMGTIVRLLGKQSQVGCLDEVYKSVEDLSTDFFRTKACKTMLLKPSNAAAEQCCQLKIKFDDTNPRSVYICRDANCCANGDGSFSSFPDAVCVCGKVMQYDGEWPQNYDGITNVASSGDGVFVRGCLKFIVTDDLQVAPASTSVMLSLFDKFGVRDPANLEQRILHLSSDKITSLLKRSLTSKQPLTDLYFDVAIAPDDAGLDILPENLCPEQGNDAEHKLNKVKIRVLQTNNHPLLYAEVGDDFVDLLFGLLSIPLGSMIKTFSQWTSKGCVANLYSSIDGSAKGWMRSECQMLLLSPKLSPFFGCGASKTLQVEELAPKKRKINSCFKCLKLFGFPNIGRCRERNINSFYIHCQNIFKTTNLCEWDPKSPEGGSYKGEAYVKQGPQNFMVTDDLRVLAMSLARTLEIVTEGKIQTEELVEKELTLTKSQVVELQRAALFTHNALSYVLLPSK